MRSCPNLTTTLGRRCLALASLLTLLACGEEDPFEPCREDPKAECCLAEDCAEDEACFASRACPQDQECDALQGDLQCHPLCMASCVDPEQTCTEVEIHEGESSAHPVRMCL